ncbi:MAG: DsrE family protein [Candidatus Manganitrophaceae bacterium]
MTRRVVILVRSNPEESHRAGEGVRIALGLVSGDHTVEIILTDKAPLLLTPEVEELIDGEMTEKFLTTLKEFIPAFYVDKTSTGTIDLSDTDYKVIPLSQEEIAEKIAAADIFSVF